MKTQNLRILILLLLISFVLFLGYRNYQKLSKEDTSVFTLIPANAALILQINDLENFSKKLNHSKIWQKCKLVQYGNQLAIDLLFIDSLVAIANSKKSKINTIFFSTHKSSYNAAAVLFSTSIIGNANLNDFFNLILPNRKEDIILHKYENTTIFEIKIKNKPYFLSEKENLVFGSSSKILVQDAIRQYEAKSNLISNTAFNKLMKTINSNAPANLYYQFNSLFDLKDIYTSQKQTKNDFLSFFTDWAANDIFIKNNAFFASGLCYANANKHFLSTLKNQKPANPKICEIIPHNTSKFLQIGISNAKNFVEKKNSFLQKNNTFYEWKKKKKTLLENSSFEMNEFLKYVDNEIGFFQIASKNKDEKNQTYSFIKSKNISQSSIFLSELVDSENKSVYNEYTIFTCKEDQLTSFLFGDIFKNSKTSFFVALENYLIFTSNTTSLEYLIDNLNSRNTLANTNHFKNFREQISSKSNLFYYTNPGKSFDNLNDNLNKKWSNLFFMNEDSLQKFTAFAFQINVGSSLFLNNIILFYDKDFKEELKQEWFGKLDTAFAIKPQIIYNYITEKEQVFVQDKNNTIYLFSTSGEKLWEEKIQERILGEVSQIDFYKNKKLQILFNTKSKLYIFDRLGRIVEDFPKKLPSNATNGHAIFDYNNNRNYRVLIATEDGELYNFDKKGHQVKGWNFKAQNSTITENTQHFVVDNKDYILYPAKNKNLSLLARNGKGRVSYNNIPEFNKQSLQVDKNGMLYGITNEGKLWRGKLDGNATEMPVDNLNANSKFLLHDNKFIYSSDKTIFVVDEKYDLLYSSELNNTIQEVTTFKDIIVVVTSKEIYLWEDGEIMEGTPIETDGFSSVCDLDKDGKINIIISRDAFLYNFEIE